MDGDGKKRSGTLRHTADQHPGRRTDGAEKSVRTSSSPKPPTTRGYVVAWNALKYTWNEERDYLWPIPADQRVLTGGLLTQNPGWTDSTNFD